MSDRDLGSQLWIGSIGSQHLPNQRLLRMALHCIVRRHWTRTDQTSTRSIWIISTRLIKPVRSISHAFTVKIRSHTWLTFWKHWMQKSDHQRRSTWSILLISKVVQSRCSSVTVSMKMLKIRWPRHSGTTAIVPTDCPNQNVHNDLALQKHACTWILFARSWEKPGFRHHRLFFL